MQNFGKIVSAAGVMALLTTPLAYAAPATVNQTTVTSDATAAAQYMLKSAVTKDHDWAILAAYAGLGTFPASTWSTAELSNLKTSVDYAKTILSILAAGQDPHNVHGHNLVQTLAGLEQTTGDNAGKFADNVDGTGSDDVNGQAWSILALEAAGGVSYNRVSAGMWLLQHQNKDGGFGYSASGAASDPDTTAIVTDALRALRFTAGTAPVKSALSYLKTQQASDGGILGYAKASDSDSTALVIDALTALGISPESWTQPNGNPGTALLALFDPTSGEFKYDNTGGQYSGPNEYSTHDGLIGLGALATGQSLFQRLHWKQLNWLNGYWQHIYEQGGAWSSGTWLTWGQLRTMAVAGSYVGDLTPTWKTTVKAHGMYVVKGSNKVWESWDSHLAALALQGSFGDNTLHLNGLE